MNHCRISLYTRDEDLRDRLIALMDEVGFTAFEEKDDALLAFIPQDLRDTVDVDKILPQPIEWEEEVIEPQNWNAVWEASFEPVIVPGFCTVRAAFHEANPNTPHEIIITPKMSFGTGHHPTTRLMMQAMQALDFSGTRSLDFGTGTGVLAILAAQLGAAEVLAIDNDSWSVENALENVEANKASAVTVMAGSLETAGIGPFDIILANINRYILLQHMPELHALLRPAGCLLLSGIFKADERIIMDAALASGFRWQKTLQEGDWIAMQFEG